VATALQRSTTVERRLQKRISVQAKITLRFPGTGQSISALNQNISWGGSLFTVAEPLPQGVDSVVINFPWTRGQLISINSNILRTQRLPNGHSLVAVRFASLAYESQLRFERLLKMLSAGDQAANSNEAPDLFQELKIIVNDVEEFRQILEQIADGQYILQKFDAYEKNQSIVISVEGPDELPEIRLRARVVDVKKAHDKVFDWSNLHFVTLEFEHPRESIARLVNHLFELLPKACGTISMA
jgi:hypothetical protein